MKIKDWLILTGSPVFAYLFYKQGWGINYTVYSIFIALCLAILSPQVIKQKNWWLAVVALFISSGCMAWYGSIVAFFATIISLLLLAAFTVNSKSPAVTNFIQSVINILLAVPNYFKGLNSASGRKRKRKPNNTAGYGYIYILIAAVFLIFVMLYSASSAAFSNLLKKIDLSFISFGWVLTAILGFFLTHGLLKHRRTKSLDKEEKKWRLSLSASLSFASPEVETKLAVENKAGTLLLALLNLLLLVVNITDISFLATGIENPQEFNFSQMVHQGVWALIMSIVFAIIIILYFFRGQLNFEKKAKPLYILALLWMLQNIVLIAMGGYKNSLYIDYVDGLTYKRLGVFFYLLLSAIGLIFTAIKIYGKKPNWYLVKVNFTVFFIVMLLSCPFDWDVIITNYNIQKAARENKTPDINYMLTFSNRNLTQVTEWVKGIVQNPDSLKDYQAVDFNDISDELRKKSLHFVNNYEHSGWQSWNYAAEENYYYLIQVRWDDLLLPTTKDEIVVPAPVNNY